MLEDHDDESQFERPIGDVGNCGIEAIVEFVWTLIWDSPAIANAVNESGARAKPKAGAIAARA